MKKIIASFFILLIISCNVGNKDQSGNKFEVTNIDNQIWMSENLNVDKFLNGDIINEAKSLQDWNKLCYEKKPAWCYYKNKKSNGLVYGKLYNKYAVLDSRGLAPNGWRIASKADWIKMSTVLGGGSSIFVGSKMLKSKSYKSTDGVNENENENNNYGFAALPGGYVSERGYSGDGDCTGWFTQDSEVIFLDLKDHIPHHIQLYIEHNNYWEDNNENYGYYVRCVKN
jgi:uncharacterized protein (TIGR02145 family)